RRARRRLAAHLGDVRAVVDPDARDRARLEHGPYERALDGAGLDGGGLEAAAEKLSDVAVSLAGQVTKRVEIVAVAARGHGRAVGQRQGHEPRHVTDTRRQA